MKTSWLLVMIILLTMTGCGSNSNSDNIEGDLGTKDNVLEQGDFLELVKEDVFGDEKSIYWDGTTASIKEDPLDSIAIDDGRYGERTLEEVTVSNKFELYYPDDLQDVEIVSETTEDYHMTAKNKNIYVRSVDYETEIKQLTESEDFLAIDKTQLSEHKTYFFEDYELFVGKEETDKGTYVGYVLVFRSALKDKKTYKISVTGIGSLEDIKVCAFDIMNHFNVLFD